MREIENDYKKIKFLTSEELILLKESQKKEKFFLLKKLQNQLRLVLNEFLNTPNIYSKKKSSTFAEASQIISYFGYHSKHKYRTIQELPEFIKIGYLYLENLKNQYQFQGEKVILTLNKFKKENYSNKWILKFNEFSSSSFTPFVSTVFIHGSCSDLTLTQFSDLDTFLIIKKDTILEIDKLIAFKKIWTKSLKFLYKFDGLQHHNHMIATDFDLDSFLYHWLPPQVINNSTIIVGNKNFSIKIVQSNYFLLYNFYQLLQRFRDPNIYNKIYNRYSFKNDISVLSILPVLFIQNLGINETKKNSFHNEYLDKVNGVTFFRKITELRASWRVPLITKFLLSTLYNKYLRIIILKYFMNKKINSNYLINSRLEKDFLFKLLKITNEMSVIISKKQINES